MNATAAQLFFFRSANLHLRLIRHGGLSQSDAGPAADWLRAAVRGGAGATAPPSPALSRLRSLCPDPVVLVRLLCLFDPPDGLDQSLVHHLTLGWRQGDRPAPWFDPTGYEALSARNPAPSEAAILHFAREGWSTGLDPDPRKTGILGRQQAATMIVVVSDMDEIPALCDLVLRHGGAAGTDWLILDRTAGHDGLRSLVSALTQPAQADGAAARALQSGRIRLVGLDRSVSPADVDALADSEADHPCRVILPLARTAPEAQDVVNTGREPGPGTPRRLLLREGRIGPVIDIYCPAPDAARAHRWGDFHFAECLAAALADLGASPRIRLADVWHNQESGTPPDATLVLRGVAPAPIVPEAVNLMWMLSHSYRPDSAELNRYDHVFVASEMHAAALRPVLGLRVSPLMQCSDPARFAALPDEDADDRIPAHPLLFVGNSRRSERWIVSAAIAAGHDLAVYGAEWEETPVMPHVRGAHVPNTELGRWYRRAAIVLNDHWPDMAARGFVSNRVFDIGMAGGFAISDRVEGSGILGEGLVSVADARELDAAIRHFLQDPRDRRRHATALHRAVRDHHTFANRAATIMARLRQLF